MNILFSIEGLLFCLVFAIMISVTFWGISRFTFYMITKSPDYNDGESMKNTRMGEMMSMSPGKQFLYCTGAALLLIFMLVIGVVSLDKDTRYLSAPMIGVPIGLAITRFLLRRNK